MITIPIEDWVFALCMLVGGGLLLITVLLDDVIGGLLEGFDIGFDIGGVSLVPLALSFIAMFGVGGLFATQVADLHGGPAAAVGAAPSGSESPGGCSRSSVARRASHRSPSRRWSGRRARSRWPSRPLGWAA
jgi:hypothetical protein